MGLEVGLLALLALIWCGPAYFAVQKARETGVCFFPGACLLDGAYRTLVAFASLAAKLAELGTRFALIAASVEEACRTKICAILVGI